MADALAVWDGYRAQAWAGLIQECIASGLTKREFCQQRGISEKSFYYWLRMITCSTRRLCCRTLGNLRLTRSWKP
ncbi:MAG: IS66 family insertion sequence element accessory protein TnpA [Faecousia sp.]